MRQAQVLLRFVVALSVLVTLPAAMAESAGQSVETRNAQWWLAKIQSAAQNLNYSGTFVYQQGNQMRSSRITHLLDGKNEIEKLEILDGSPREYIRKNDEVICYMPEARTMWVEKSVGREVFPAILAGSPGELIKFYHVTTAESGRIGGHESQAVMLEPKDKLRYGYKLWADKNSGLLLRSQTLNDKGESIEQIAFTNVEIGKIDRNKVKTSFSNTAGWQVENTLASQDSQSGWTVRALPSGFNKVREVKRLVPNADDSGKRAGQHELTQIVFSDGLAAISVFIEPESRSRTEGSMQQGAVNIIGRRHGDYWLTVVGEVPAAAIRRVADSIEFKSR